MSASLHDSFSTARHARSAPCIPEVVSYPATRSVRICVATSASLIPLPELAASARTIESHVSPRSVCPDGTHSSGRARAAPALLTQGVYRAPVRARERAQARDDELQGDHRQVDDAERGLREAVERRADGTDLACEGAECVPEAGEPDRVQAEQNSADVLHALDKYARVGGQPLANVH
jgi:hypothetical protein